MVEDYICCVQFLNPQSLVLSCQLPASHRKNPSKDMSVLGQPPLKHGCLWSFYRQDSSRWSAMDFCWSWELFLRFTLPTSSLHGIIISVSQPSLPSHRAWEQSPLPDVETALLLLVYPQCGAIGVSYAVFYLCSVLLWLAISVQLHFTDCLLFKLCFTDVEERLVPSLLVPWK